MARSESDKTDCKLDTRQIWQYNQLLQHSAQI